MPMIRVNPSVTIQEESVTLRMGVSKLDFLLLIIDDALLLLHSNAHSNGMCMKYFRENRYSVKALWCKLRGKPYELWTGTTIQSCKDELKDIGIRIYNLQYLRTQIIAKGEPEIVWGDCE